VLAAAARRFAVTAQLTATVDEFSWWAMTPSTGTTAVCSTATVRTTTDRPATSSPGRRTDASAPRLDRVASVSTTACSDR
jgi:hypothetical protein